MSIRSGGPRGPSNLGAPVENHAPRTERAKDKDPPAAPAVGLGGSHGHITGEDRSVLPVGVAVDNHSRPVRFTLKNEHRIDVPEPSGLAFLSEADGFVIASDCEKKLYVVPFPGKDSKKDLKPDTLKADGGRKHLGGLEGVAYDPHTRSVLVVSEDREEVSEIPLDRRKMLLGEATKVGKLPDITRLSNKGWEGLTVLPGSLSPDGKSRLLAVHEGAPRRLAVLDRNTLEAEAVLKLPDSMKDALKDLSDVAVDPISGHLFILSDESRTVFEAALTARTRPGTGGMLKQGWEITPVGATEIPGHDGKTRLQPEGLSFDARGDLWVIAEHKQSLFHLARQS